MTALIPRSVLFGGGYPVPSLSPDGERIGFVQPVEGVPNLCIGPAEDPLASKPVTSDRVHGIRFWQFCHDNRTVVYAQDRDGDENWRLYAVDVADGEVRALTPGEGVYAMVLHYTHVHPTTMVIGLLDRGRRLIDPYRLDITSGVVEQLDTNPGYGRWLIDSELRIRGGMRGTAEGGQVIYLRDLATGIDQPWMTISPEDTSTVGAPMFARTGEIYLSSGIGANTRRLVRIDPESGEQTVLVGHDVYDLGEVYSDPATMCPQSAVILGDRKQWVHLDEEFGAVIDSLNTRLDGDISVSRPSGSDTQWLVAESSDRAATRYHRYRTATGELTPLYPERPTSASYNFAAMEPFALTARDGLQVRGYLSFPVGVPRTALPAVVLVHGGPALRDSWGYKPSVQWLANRGYAVIQVNFRGSSGFGKTFANAGDREWGRGMLYDLVDAVAHVTAREWVDPERVAIYGGSFGGYAALCAAAFTAGVFCAAVDICGPSNLLTLYDSTPAQHHTSRAYFHRQVGDPATESDLLWERSPLSRATDIDIPLLIVQGRNDPRVPISEAEQITAALTAAGIDHQYLVFDDEGHGITKPRNVERLHDAVEAFLAAHLGGRVQCPGEQLAD